MPAATTATLPDPSPPQIPPMLQEPALRTLFGAERVESLRMNQPLFWEGEPAEHVFEVLDGVLRLYRTLPDGRRAITGFVYPGGMLGPSFRHHYHHTAEAVTPTRLRRLPRVRLQARLASQPSLNGQLHALVCDELSASEDLVLLLARKTAAERVASFLLQLAQKLRRAHAGSGTRVTLPMTRQDIADYLGLTIETVSRCITALKNEGVISLVDAQRIVVQQYDKLKLLAGDEE